MVVNKRRLWAFLMAETSFRGSRDFEVWDSHWIQRFLVCHWCLSLLKNTMAKENIPAPEPTRRDEQILHLSERIISWQTFLQRLYHEKD
ncbi:hypothetical protein Tco_0113554 [Tanacetum coccineum]